MSTALIVGSTIAILLVIVIIIFFCTNLFSFCSLSDAPRIHKGVEIDVNGDILSCRFCTIVQEQNTVDKEQTITANSTSPAPPVENPDHIFFATPWAVVFAPLKPRALHHLLVVPRQHIANINAVSSEMTVCSGQSRRDEWPFDIHHYEGDDEYLHTNKVQRQEEEKALTPLQLIDHMMEVGEYCLTNPHVLCSSKWKPGSRLDYGRRRRWRICGQKTTNDSSESPMIRPGMNDGIVRPLNPKYTSEEKEKTSGNEQANRVNSSGPNKRKGRQGKITKKLSYEERKAESDSEQVDFSTDTVDSDPNEIHNPEMATLLNDSDRSSSDTFQDISNRINGYISPDLTNPHDQLRYYFHRPPFNSVDHLHLHCMRLPHKSFISKVAFYSNTFWCWTAERLREELVKQEDRCR